MKGTRHLALTKLTRILATGVAATAALLWTAAGSPAEAAHHSHRSHDKSSSRAAHRSHKAESAPKHKSKHEKHASKPENRRHHADADRSSHSSRHARRDDENAPRHAHKMSAHERRLEQRHERLAAQHAEHANRKAAHARKHPSAHEQRLADHEARLAAREKRIAEARSERRSHSRHNDGRDRRIAAHERRLAAHNRRVAILEERRRARFARSLSRMSAHQRKVAVENEALHSGSVVQAAQAFEGTRYRFGGTSRSGFDCSGFTRYILGNTAGVEIPRTAVEQYYNGKPIDRDDMQPGDLVFFRNTYKPGISHVGIYVGDGKFVHAANSHKGVVVEHLDTPYYAHRFAGARRVTDRGKMTDSESDQSVDDSGSSEDGSDSN